MSCRCRPGRSGSAAALPRSSAISASSSSRPMSGVGERRQVACAAHQASGAAGKSAGSPSISSCQIRSGAGRSLSRCSPRSRRRCPSGSVGCDEGPRRVRDEDLAAMPGRGDPGRAMDVDPDVVVAAQPTLAGVQPHPDAHGQRHPARSARRAPAARRRRRGPRRWPRRRRRRRRRPRCSPRCQRDSRWRCEGPRRGAPREPAETPAPSGRHEAGRALDIGEQERHRRAARQRPGGPELHIHRMDSEYGNMLGSTSWALNERRRPAPADHRPLRSGRLRCHAGLRSPPTVRASTRRSPGPTAAVAGVDRSSRTVWSRSRCRRAPTRWRCHSNPSVHGRSRRRRLSRRPGRTAMVMSWLRVA